ncbi:G-protein coupled receptor 4-like [Stegastes partitus]|uniref:G-protein coupled receptor 4-like n=1 Tax=Stegastes partitus TaxID=144197 RepID=A0A9Y4KCL1_9TELE|nr:PREDICTED: G-protein coupled receptor 4-like [Stegastes partitus]
MKNSSCLDINFDFKSKYLPPVLITVFIIGVVANGLGLKSLMHNWKKLGIVNVFVLNLGLADILYLLTLPFLMVYYRKNEWIFGEEFCKMTRFCFNLNLYGSIGFLTCISVYRYLAIVHTMRVMGKITVTHSVAISVMVWLLVTVQILPDMFYPKTTYKNNTMDCFDTTSKDYVEDYLNYSLGWTFTGFCIPFLITLGCYGHVIAVLCRTNTIDKVLKQRCLVLLFILILLFSVCYIPFHVLKNLNLWSRVLSKQRICQKWFNGVFIAHQICRGLVCLNSALNPLVYLNVNEGICTQLRQLPQRARQAFTRLSSQDPLAFCFSRDTMKNSSCPRINFAFPGKFLPPIYSFVFIIGLAANGWGLKSLLRNWTKLKIINVFLLNIGLADILYLLTLLFLMVKNEWIFGQVICKMTRFCFNLNLYGSIGFLTCVSVYRYLAIVHPVKVMGRLTVSYSVAISVMVWLLVTVQILPDMFYTKTKYKNSTRKCFDTTSKDYVEDYLYYSLGWTLTGFFIPLIITLGCYGHVIVVLCRRNTIDKVLKQRSLKLLLFMILLFCVCYIPYHILKNLNLTARVLQRQNVCRKWFNGVYIAYQISRGLVCLNSALNPLVYLHSMDDCLASLRKLLHGALEVFSQTPRTNSHSVPLRQITDV